MSWIIDEVAGKSGAFANWRYKRVLIDENGIVTTANIPGKQSLNLPCLSSYNKRSRGYSNGQLITEFCNTTTFTNYRVYAQDCDPFAYVQTDINAPKCGYIEPLPEPAVPPNPFGTAVYGLYKFYDFCSIKLENYRVSIYKKDFGGTATAIPTGGPDPVVLSYSTEDEDDKFSPIRACECQLNFVVDENFSLQELYTSDERAFKVIVTNTDTEEVKFAGFIIPDSCREPFDAPPYQVSVRATDGLGALKTLTYPLPVGSRINIRQSFKDIVCYCLAMTNLNLDLRTVVNIYELKMNTGMDDDPLSQASINPLRLSDDKGNIKDCYTVLEDVCRLFGAYISQVNGQWVLVRLNELSNAVVRSRLYSYTGFFKRSEQLDNVRLASSTEDDVTVLAGGELRTENAYKRVIVLTEYGNSVTTLYNGDFENWDGQNFRYWTRYGGIKISRVQKEVTGTGGAKIGIQDYAMQFDEELNEGRWVESVPIVAEQGDKISFSFNVGGDGTRGWNLLKFRLKIGEYYLSGAIPEVEISTSENLQWVKQLAVVQFATPNNSNINTFKCSINIPEIPTSGTLVVQMYGAARYRVRAGHRRVLEDPLPYTPVPIDNISISKSAKDDKGPDGFWSISEQLGFYTNSPDEIVLPFGDSQVPNSTSISDSLALSSLYAIYTSDNSFSKLWKDYNEVGQPLPITLCLARSILKAYQKPFRFFQGDLRGDNLNYLNAFRFDVPGGFKAKLFSVISGDFSLKHHDLTNATLAEIFSRPVQTVNYQTPHSPGQIPPAIVQNPNNPGNTNRVFSNEFTNPFA